MHTFLRISSTFCGLVVLALLCTSPSQAQWAAQPGATVRDAFGPPSAGGANICRGACGGGCPSSCERLVSFECGGDAQLVRVVCYDCGTHAACRAHDDCLDTCVNSNSQGDSGDCQARCDVAVMEDYDPLAATAWLSGQGPYDGRIIFEYARDTPQGLQAGYQCPDGTRRQCAGGVGCVSATGELYEPMFASYPGLRPDAMQVSSLRTGKVCDDHVCEYTVDIAVTGEDTCAGQRCTRFGVEFDYRNADPALPLECQTSTTGGKGDFINNLLKLGADAMGSRSPQDSGKTKAGEKDDAPLSCWACSVKSWPVLTPPKMWRLRSRPPPAPKTAAWSNPRLAVL